MSRRSPRATYLRWVVGLVPIAVLLGIWQLVGKSASGSTPVPSSWWPAFKTIEESGQLWVALGKTMRLYGEGLVVSTILGVAFGIALGSSKVASRGLSPLLEFLRATPAAAIVPGLLILFHANTRTELLIVVYGSIWPILLNTAAARAALPPLRLEVGYSMGLTWWERMRKLVLPTLIPEIVVGVRVAASICLIVSLLVDYLVATGGIGYLLVQYQQTYQGSSAFALLAVVGIVGILLNVILGISEHYVLRRWPRASAAGSGAG
jgi:ABC-type nitrate/sulfonate/bicarbonate transport system permease component